MGLVRLEETVTKEMRGEGLVERCIQGGGGKARKAVADEAGERKCCGGNVWISRGCWEGWSCPRD